MGLNIDKVIFLKIINDKMRKKLYTIIFLTDTASGKRFDLFLIFIIVTNVFFTIIESIDWVMEKYEYSITVLSWFFLLLFAIEYILRILVVENKYKYFFSFFGIIDLLAILPLIFIFFLPEIRFLVLVRIFRLFKLFSIFKMGRYIDQSSYLLSALRASRTKIIVFLITIIFIVVIVGTFMYIIEGPTNGFVSIPTAMYWAVVTISTVGYGDISPNTSLGKIISSLLMIIGYGIIAVPTGIISHELANTGKKRKENKVCTNCSTVSYDIDDIYCSRCGKKLKE